MTRHDNVQLPTSRRPPTRRGDSAKRRQIIDGAPRACSWRRASTPPAWARSRARPASPRARSTSTSRARRSCSRPSSRSSAGSRPSRSSPSTPGPRRRGRARRGSARSSRASCAGRAASRRCAPSSPSPIACPSSAPSSISPGPARGIASLQAYLEGKVAAGVLEPHDCEVAAAQFIDSCVSTDASSRCCSISAVAPEDAQISHVVGMAVHALLAAYRTV